MNLKTTALNQPVKTEPRNVLPENHAKPNLQSIGTKMPLDTAPTAVKYGANTPSGKMEIIGDKIKLNQSVQSGYASGNTPMSNRTDESKKGF